MLREWIALLLVNVWSVGLHPGLATCFYNDFFFTCIHGLLYLLILLHFLHEGCITFWLYYRCDYIPRFCGHLHHILTLLLMWLHMMIVSTYLIKNIARIICGSNKRVRDHIMIEFKRNENKKYVKNNQEVIGGLYPII